MTYSKLTKNSVKVDKSKASQKSSSSETEPIEYIKEQPISHPFGWSYGKQKTPFQYANLKEMTENWKFFLKKMHPSTSQDGWAKMWVETLSEARNSKKIKRMMKKPLLDILEASRKKTLKETQKEINQRFDFLKEKIEQNF